MESVDYRKFGRRNLGAKLAATTARAPRGLEKYSPQLCNQWTFHWCRCGFRTPWKHKKRPQPDKTTIAKNNSSTLSCESCPFPFPPPSTYTTPTGTEANDDRTGIVKWHTCQTLQNQCETAPKQAPQSNISKGRPPKGEIQIKICLRWTASPFNMLARKFRKLKIVPPSRKGFFLTISIFQKKRKNEKVDCARIPLPMSCEIA